MSDLPEPPGLPSADDLLAELAREGDVPLGRFGQEIGEAYVKMKRAVVAQANGERPQRLKVLSYSHEDCIDRIIATPGIDKIDLAQVYGVTPTWISIVTNSDAFRTRLAERRAELIDPALLASLNERYGALASRSVEVLLEKLHQPIEKISDKLALEAAALGAKAMGLGEAKAPAGPSAVDHLASLAHRLVDLNRPPPIEVEAQRIN